MSAHAATLDHEGGAGLAASFAALNRRRRSWLGWSGEALARDQLTALVAEAHLAPSEANLQPWRFVAAQGAALERLSEAFIASNRPKIHEAGTVMLVLGDTATIDADPKATLFYDQGWFSRRDFAMRNAALAAMSFMYAAAASGYGTRPMVGFDPSVLGRLAAIPDTWIPVVAIAVGIPATPRHEPRTRHPVAQVVSFL
jgi:nitroreductase